MQAARRAVAEDEAGNLSAAMANYKTAVELMLPALGALPESHRGPVRAQVERYLARAEELKVQVVAAAAAAPPPAAQPQAESSGGGAVEEEIARCITMFKAAHTYEAHMEVTKNNPRRCCHVLTSSLVSWSLRINQ